MKETNLRTRVAIVAAVLLGGIPGANVIPGRADGRPSATRIPGGDLAGGIGNRTATVNACSSEQGIRPLFFVGPQPRVTLSLVSVCDNCTITPLSFADAPITVGSPALGYRLTPASFGVDLGSRVSLKAPFAFTAGGRSLRFKHWFSIADQTVLTTSPELSGFADRTETLAAVYEVYPGGRKPTTVRVHAIRVADDDGGRQTRIEAASFKQWVDKANQVYAVAGVQFQFDAGTNSPDWSELRSTRLNNMEGTQDPDWAAERDAANVVAAQYPGQLVVLCRWGRGDKDHPTGGGFSWTDYNFVAMPGYDTFVCSGARNLGLFAHETGHYLGLAHPFALEFPTRTKAEEYLRSESNRTIPAAGDFNGDGRHDIVTFTRGNTGDAAVALSNGSQFVDNTGRWHESFSFGDEIPLVGDFDGDGKTDVVTFTRGTTGSVFVALSDGTQLVGSALRWLDGFCFGDEVPAVGDFNGDGRADIASFTRGSTGAVSVALSNGTRFATPSRWHQSFGFGNEVPAVGDFNGDGKADIVTFTRGNTGQVFVALSDGTRFVGTAVRWHDSFCFGDETPLVGDFNGDRKADIVTFTRGNTGDVYVALSDGTKFTGTASRWHDTFDFGNEVPVVGDFNGDGKADIAAFTRGEAGDVFVALSYGTQFVGNGVKWQDDFGSDRAVFDGDGFSDTTPDPFMRDYDGRSVDCGPTPVSVTLAGLEFRLPRTNLMSFYHPDFSVASEVRTLTTQQINRVREWLEKRGFR